MFSHTAIAGQTNRKRKKLNAAKNSVPKSKPGLTRVSYCPHCVAPDLKYPQTVPHVRVGMRIGRGACKNGHTWKIAGSVYR